MKKRCSVPAGVHHHLPVSIFPTSITHPAHITERQRCAEQIEIAAAGLRGDNPDVFAALQAGRVERAALGKIQRSGSLLAVDADHGAVVIQHQGAMPCGVALPVYADIDRVITLLANPEKPAVPGSWACRSSMLSLSRESEHIYNPGRASYPPKIGVGPNQVGEPDQGAAGRARAGCRPRHLKDPACIVADRRRR